MEGLASSTLLCCASLTSCLLAPCLDGDSLQSLFEQQSCEAPRVLDDGKMETTIYALKESTPVAYAHTLELIMSHACLSVLRAAGDSECFGDPFARARSALGGLKATSLVQ